MNGIVPLCVESCNRPRSVDTVRIHGYFVIPQLFCGTTSVEEQNGGAEGSASQDYVIEDHADNVLGTFKTQKEAIDWAKAKGHAPLVARVRHLNDKKNPDHWRSA